MPEPLSAADIAEGRRLMRALADPRTGSEADGQMAAWLFGHLPALVDAAEELINPPGYLVGWEGVDGPELYSGHREIVHDREAALGKLSSMRDEEPCMDFQLYTVHKAAVSGE